MGNRTVENVLKGPGLELAEIYLLMCSCSLRYMSVLLFRPEDALCLCEHVSVCVCVCV